ncbi:MAG: electron transfer flavoprotein subunit beta/FixA family protein [Deltaproteobacteria bacterium]|nr:electron transfer flavoprotein subunit beta/FixA family protein [Deltaproteobacteria bacterium]
MNILVCIKQVPDTEAEIKPTSDGKGVNLEGLKFVMNVYDEYGVEEALKLKESQGGEVTLISLGPDRAVEAIRTGLAMGADKAVHINDPAFEGSDAIVTAKVLANVIKDMEYDIIFCGKQAIDDDLAQVGTALAEFLGIPSVAVINKFEMQDGKAIVHRQVEGGEEVFEVPLPAVFTCQKGLNEPRYPSLPGIMKAKKKPMEIKKLSDVGMEASQVGVEGSKTKILKVVLPPARSAGKKIEGETPDEIAQKLAKALKEEAKVI